MDLVCKVIVDHLQDQTNNQLQRNFKFSHQKTKQKSHDTIPELFIYFWHFTEINLLQLKEGLNPNAIIVVPIQSLQFFNE